MESTTSSTSAARATTAQPVPLSTVANPKRTRLR